VVKSMTPTWNRKKCLLMHPTLLTSKSGSGEDLDVEEGYRNQLDSEIGNVRGDALTFSLAMYTQIDGKQPFSTTIFYSVVRFGETL
jgi:hypothetical protein